MTAPDKAVAAEHWYRHRTTVENISRDSKLGAALRHLPSGYPQVNAAWMWGALPAATKVVDDVLPPWRPRCVLIRGRAEALAAATGPDGEPPGPIIRLHPTEVISWGMEFAGE